MLYNLYHLLAIAALVQNQSDLSSFRQHFSACWFFSLNTQQPCRFKLTFLRTLPGRPRSWTRQGPCKVEDLTFNYQTDNLCGIWLSSSPSSCHVAVVECYQDWCGPCKAIFNTFKRLYFELGDRPLKFYTVSDVIVILKKGGKRASQLCYREQALELTCFIGSTTVYNALAVSATPQHFHLRLCLYNFYCLACYHFLRQKITIQLYS